MTVLTTIGREIVGLFVDDGSLAVAILAWVAVVAVLMAGMNVNAAIAGGVLFAGLVAILLENVLRRARSR